jgi:hypothetical protein
MGDATVSILVQHSGIIYYKYEVRRPPPMQSWSLVASPSHPFYDPYSGGSF